MRPASLAQRSNKAGRGFVFKMMSGLWIAGCGKCGWRKWHHRQPVAMAMAVDHQQRHV